MKKLLFSLLLGASVGFVQAQNFVSQSFLNVRSLATGTNNTGVTNTLAVTTNVIGGGVLLCHPTNTCWTNLAGSFVINTNFTGALATNSVAQAGLFHDVSLWVDREGRPYNSSSTTAQGSTTNFTITTPSTLFIKLSAVSNVIANVGFVFCPVWDGTNTPMTTADDWSVVFTAAAGRLSTLATNVPIYKWPGAKALRLRYVTNDVGGATNVYNGTWIQSLSLNGFVP